MSNHTKTQNGKRHILLFLFFQLLATLPGNPQSNSVQSYWDKFNGANQTRVDHAQWQIFLDRYLHQTEDGRSLVDYKNVATVSYDELESYIRNLARLDPRGFNRAEQMVFWINLYNALTVKVVLDNPDKTTITKMGQGLFSFGPWNEKVFTITSQSLSLNDIEHRILRPIWKDSRVHFALNCASLGCPNLASTVYQSENLEADLDTARRKYLAHPRALHFDALGDLYISSLFEWYLGDFAKDETALLVYLAHHRPDLKARLLGYVDKIRYTYDWDLNTLVRRN